MKTDEKKVLTYFDRGKKNNCPTGTEFDKTYTMEIDENGHKELKHTGETNRYAKIQSHAEETKIENILARATIDPTVLNVKNGQYFDATDMPKTLAEAQMLMQKVKNEFESLPVDVRAKFNNSPEEYIAAYGNEKWANALGLVKEADVEENATKKESEVKADNE